jgi:hypothetical protein
VLAKWPSNYTRKIKTLAHTHTHTHTHTHKVCMWMFIAALPITAKNLEKISFNVWMNKLWYIYIMNTKTNLELSIHTTVWINLKSVMLSGRNWHQSFHTMWFHLYIIGEKTKWWGQRIHQVCRVSGVWEYNHKGS